MSDAQTPRPKRPARLPAGPAPSWIAEPVPILHPARVQHRPKRWMEERGSFVGQRTPARLRGADPGAFEPVAMVPAETGVGTAVYAHGGDTWALLTRRSGRLVTPDELNGFLQGASTRGSEPDLGEIAFRRTPLAATHYPGLRVHPGDERYWRGSDEAGIGAVVRDGRPAAAAALLAWLDANLVVAGGNVLMRWRPTLYWHPKGEGDSKWGVVALTQLDAGLGGLAIKPSTFDAVAGLAAGFGPYHPKEPGPEWRLAATDDDGDIALGVNIQAHLLRQRLERRLGAEPDALRLAAIEAAVRSLVEIEWRAALGLAAQGEHRRDADAFRAVVALEAELGGPKAGLRTGNAYLHAWMEAVVAPRLDGIQEADAEAIAGFAP